MSRFFSCLCVALAAFPLTLPLWANETQEPQAAITQEVTPADNAPFSEGSSPLDIPPTLPIFTPPQAKEPFAPFTGKVKAKKVRLRLHADLESPIVRELHRNELVGVVGEKGEFWEVEAPKGLHAYVFRSFVIENVVEGNRVNIRLEPNLEAPIIGHLNAGDRVEGAVSSANNKWLQIPVPSTTHFYVAKDYLENIGGLSLKSQYDERITQAEQKLQSALLLGQAELHKPFEEVDTERLTHIYTTLIGEYQDLLDYAAKAKQALADFQQSYKQKKIEFLENKNSGKQEFSQEETLDRMRVWQPIEEHLYQAWATLNENPSQEAYYEEQKLTAIPLTGILEAYTAPIKNKPGDYLLKDRDFPVAYLYSTQVNLQPLVGKKVTVLVSPRPNNHFAFPAYFVHSVE